MLSIQIKIYEDGKLLGGAGQSITGTTVSAIAEELASALGDATRVAGILRPNQVEDESGLETKVQIPASTSSYKEECGECTQCPGSLLQMKEWANYFAFNSPGKTPGQIFRDTLVGVLDKGYPLPEVVSNLAPLFPWDQFYIGNVPVAVWKSSLLLSLSDFTPKAFDESDYDYVSKLMASCLALADVNLTGRVGKEATTWFCKTMNAASNRREELARFPESVRPLANLILDELEKVSGKASVSLSEKGASKYAQVKELLQDEKTIDSYQELHKYGDQVANTVLYLRTLACMAPAPLREDAIPIVLEAWKQAGLKEYQPSEIFGLLGRVMSTPSRSEELFRGLLQSAFPASEVASAEAKKGKVLSSLEDLEDHVYEVLKDRYARTGELSGIVDVEVAEEFTEDQVKETVLTASARVRRELGFDSPRLVESLHVGDAGDGLFQSLKDHVRKVVEGALSAGKTALELKTPEGVDKATYGKAIRETLNDMGMKSLGKLGLEEDSVLSLKERVRKVREEIRDLAMERLAELADKAAKTSPGNASSEEPKAQPSSPSSAEPQPQAQPSNPGTASGLLRGFSKEVDNFFAGLQKK